MNLQEQTITSIAAGLESGEFSAVELTGEYLKAIEADKTNSFISSDPQFALEAAAKADQTRAEGQASVLTGVPIAIKDVLTVKGLLATGGSKILQNYYPPYTATSVARLQQAGMVIVGKTNCDEFAMGSSNENSAYGSVLNPVDITRVPGGSSGGSAAAVAGGLAPAALGTDTGGSVRQPAAFCGLLGLKPTYGRISRYGLMSMASSLDTVGIFSKTAEDCALLLQVMAGKDSHDSTSSAETVPAYFQHCRQQQESLRIGLPKQYYLAGLDERLRKVLEQTIERLKKKGHTFVEVDLPYAEYALAAYYVIMPAEVSSNLARYDGLRYGLSVAGENLDQHYRVTRTTGFGTEVKRRILLGTYALSAGYYQAYYLQAQKVRQLIKQDYDQAFKQVDMLLTPTTPTVAFRLGEKVTDPLSMYLADIYTVSANIVGIPGLNIPIGAVDGLPVGMQLLGPSWSEETMLRFAHHWQEANG
jgi:aspartyl-tRNA(Asn)/glutamyl-tRNA(Gln) amidotransferase subunit A